MKAGTLVRLVRNKPLYNTITVASDNEGRDMSDQVRSRVFTIRPEMVGICVVEGGKGVSMKVLVVVLSVS